jgi:molybdenum cofactor biosynthesis enzyme MoaA
MQQNNTSHNDFYFQWHITDRCNLRCSHCYQNDYSLKTVADKINHALTVWKKEGRLAITGGEPFIRKDLFDLLHYLEQQPTIKKIGILSNGTLIT